MAGVATGLKRVYKKRFKGVTLKTGHVYTFKYQAWEHDPKPTIIFMHSIEGIHPRSKHQWRIIQAINFTYLPRAIRKRFMKDWLKVLESPTPPKFHWQRVKAKYPDLEKGIRRYFFKPNYYITNLKEVPFEDIEKVVISTYSKDFSKKVVTTLRAKFRKALSFRIGNKKKKQKGKRRKRK